MAGEEIAGPAELLAALARERRELARRVELLEARAGQIAFESVCGAKDDSQHIEFYDGTLGVTRDFVEHFSPPVGQLQWNADLPQRFSGAGQAPGNVNDVRWGTGGLMTTELFITAGHCFDSEGSGWVLPSRDGFTIQPAEIARLMHVNFNFQLNRETQQPRPEDRFPVLELLEHRVGGLDYAIVRLGQNAEGALPGQKYGTLSVAGGDLTAVGAMLCVIQHPNGSPKKIEAGPLLNNNGGRISYDSIDTLGGSSGSPIISQTGEVVGVHTNGGCTAFSGANFGVAIGAIRRFSSIL
jgi:hypothetical protein